MMYDLERNNKKNLFLTTVFIKGDVCMYYLEIKYIGKPELANLFCWTTNKDPIFLNSPATHERLEKSIYYFYYYNSIFLEKNFQDVNLIFFIFV